MDDLPSPLEHLGQQAAAVRSRVTSANRTSNRGRIAEVLRRIDGVDSRHSFPSISASRLETYAPAGSVIRHPSRSDSTSETVSPRSTFHYMTRDGALSSLDPEGLPLPTTRHRRTFPRDIQIPEPTELELLNSNHLSIASSSRHLTPTRQSNLRSPTSGGSSTRFSGLMSSPSPQPHRGHFAVNLVREDLPIGLPSRRQTDSSGDLILMPRTRPSSSPRNANAYERNNDFLARIATAERVNAELGRSQRPTPPPAIGHGRPTPEQQSLPRNRRPIPHWQRNQENSEEAAMSGLQYEMRNMRVRSENDPEDRDGVMDDTPPRDSRVDRYLRE
jgi:hypothetical protein